MHDALIVGAGIGGLTAALFLARKGLRVTVLDQAPELGEVGAGIQVSPNASRLLAGLGLADALSAVASVPESLDMRNWRSGGMIFSKPLGAKATSFFRAPYLNIHRADLHQVLLQAVLRESRIQIELNERCKTILQEPGRAAVVTSNGREHHAAVVIGADGIRSAVREALFGPEKPRFTGCVAWRGVVPARAIGVAVPTVAALWMGPQAHFVHYYVRGGAYLNFVGVVERTGWEVESWTEKGDKRELVETFGRWHAPVDAIVKTADPDGCFKWALFDRKPMPSWTRGVVTLLGDACHPMLPFMAQGACMAIEDAAVLAECLGTRTDVSAALQRYESIRRGRTASIQQNSTMNKKLYHLNSSIAWIRDMGAPMVAGHFGRRLDNLFAYDALAAAH